MSGVLMTLDASILGDIRIGEGRRVCDSGRRGAGLVEQMVVTMKASSVWQAVLHLFSHLLQIVWPAEVMFVNVFCAVACFGGDMGEVLFLGRQVTIYAVDANAVGVGAVRRKLPAQIGCIHLVAFAAAIFGR